MSDDFLKHGIIGPNDPRVTDWNSDIRHNAELRGERALAQINQIRQYCERVMSASDPENFGDGAAVAAEILFILQS